MGKLSNRIPSLDGLRTISIILVIVGHLFHVLGYGYLGNLGNLGVRVFFVISGFLITGLLLKELEKTSTIGLGKFYFRRTLRIFPPYYFYLVIILIATVVGVIQVSPYSIFIASTYLTNYINPGDWYLGHAWSLSVEEQFYLLFPGILVFLGIRKTKIFLCFVIILSPFIRVFDFVYFGESYVWVGKGFHENMDALAIGCLLSLFYSRLHENALYCKLIKSKIVVIFVFLIVVSNLQTDHQKLFLGASISVMNILIAICIDWAVTNYDSFAGKILNSTPMITIGAMSYSIYLWQQPFFNPDHRHTLTQTPYNFIALAIMTIISYYFVEKYSLRFRQDIEQKLFPADKSVSIENPPNETWKKANLLPSE